MPRPIVALSAAFAALCLLATGAAAQKGAPDGTPTDVSLDIELDATGYMLRATQTWEGKPAYHMRQSLDAFFGAADGNLTEDEISRIAEASSRDMTNDTLAWIWLDGENALVTHGRVSFENAAGPVESDRPLIMHHEVRADMASGGDAPTEVQIDPMWSGTLKLAAPEGSLVEGVKGLTGGDAGDGWVTGLFRAGRNVTMTLAPAPAMPDEATPPPTPDSGATDPKTVVTDPPPAPGLLDVPGPAPLLAALATLGAALVVARRR